MMKTAGDSKPKQAKKSVPIHYNQRMIQMLLTDKAGKESGYTATFTETCNSENDVQIIVDYTVEPNNKSDVEIFQDRMDIIKDNTNASDIYADGSYYGENVINKANSKGIETSSITLI